MRRLALAFALLPAAAVAGAAAGGLAVVPRTAAEAARVAAVTVPATDFSAPESFEARPGGAATSGKPPDANAFSRSSANMSFERELDFKVGNGFFRKLWVTAPSSTRVSDGLGPLFNARSCQSCHLKDGRGHPPTGPDDPAVGMFLRLSVPADPAEVAATSVGIEDYLATLPDPTYGGQLQTFAVPGLPAEGRMQVSYEELPVTLAGGEVVSLRRPSYAAVDLAYGPLAPDALLSPRVAPQMIGLGLLEAVPEADILALADPDDADGDGISGRANLVWSEEAGRPMLGRFGWKAGQPTIRAQAASAFSGDIGISTPLEPQPWGDCTEAEAECRAQPHGGDPEAEGTVLDLVTFYSRNLAVPARRDLDDPEVLAGKRVFYEAGCAGCHQPKFVTDRLADQPEQSFQLIWPHTDLLLHDMGEGLADHRPEGRASGTEWRTAPLWGIGLTATVTGQASFLHDGRARTLLEAVLWHGGEAQAARDTVAQLPKAERDALIRFLEFALMLRLTLAALLLLGAPALAQTDHAAIARRALEASILPGFAQLAHTTATLAAEADAACSGAGPIEAGPVKDAYNRAFDAWIGVEHLRFGPAQEDNAGFALAFWPDTKGSTPRTLDAMVAGEDPAVDDAAAFAAVSVAARGFFALDYLLYDPAAAPIVAGSYRCRLLMAISRDAAATAARMLERWRDPWAGFLTTAGAAENPVYQAPDELTRALYSALTEALQADVGLRLGRPMGALENPQPRRAEAWRSGRSLHDVDASIRALRGFTATVFSPAIPPAAAAAVDASFEAALAAVGQVGEPIDVAVATTQGWSRVEALQTAVRRVQVEIAEHVGPALGVTSGFNAMDGDGD